VPMNLTHFFSIHKIALNLGNVSTMSDFAVCWTPIAKLGNVGGVITVKLSAQFCIPSVEIRKSWGERGEGSVERHNEDVFRLYWYLYMRVLPRIPLGSTQFPCD
jgi:hypothetical protein